VLADQSSNVFGSKLMEIDTWKDIVDFWGIGIELVVVVLF